MAARCASCSYPLSVSDSVSCCECTSYFHIDCAQLVGFPYYELSSDPIRNTFHCQTCKILPLPRQCDSDDGMPSRQLECHLEGHDFAADMNEVKGTVQDLSDLCKDMFREISELKSINLTLRCCVENLRHDGEQRDAILTDLKRRVEALEGKRGLNLFKPIDIGTYSEEINIEKDEDPERYLTPDPEYSRTRELETNDQSKRIPPADYEQDFTKQNSKCETSETALQCEQITNHTLETSETDFGIPIPETSDFIQEEKIDEVENMHYAEEETISTTFDEENNEVCAITSVKDWGWKGNKAIQLKESGDQSPREEEDEENKTTDTEDTEAQGWEILGEVVTSDLTTTHCEETFNQVEVVEVEAVEERRVTWADEVKEYNKEDENVQPNEDTVEHVLKSENKYYSDVASVNAECSSLEGEETEEKTEDITDGGERTSLKSLRSEEGDERSRHEEDVEMVEESAEAEGRTEGSRLEGEPRLEGDSLVEEGAGLEGMLEGGQSPEHHGEAQPSELLEGSELLPPPQPQHTPDDLWDYLKETVSGEHPATVEEFVQKLIGTLEHVPEEYLKPVIDYNIKRATSPSVTDGEHLETKEGDQVLQDEVHVTEETATEEACPEGEVALEGEDTLSPAEGEAGFPSEESALYEDKNLPEEPSESSAGYSALEATM